MSDLFWDRLVNVIALGYELCIKALCRVKAVIRFIMAVVFRRWLKPWNYPNPHAVGYAGGVDLWGRTLAFKTLSGDYIFYW